MLYSSLSFSRLLGHANLFRHYAWLTIIGKLHLHERAIDKHTCAVVDKFFIYVYMCVNRDFWKKVAIEHSHKSLYK